MRIKMIELNRCCLCDKVFAGKGNNPEPLAHKGVCCDECNKNVIRKRFMLISSKGETHDR